MGSFLGWLSLMLLALHVGASLAMYHPACPQKLKTRDERFECYKKVMVEVHDLIFGADPTNPEANKDAMKRHLAGDIIGRTNAGTYEGTELNAAYLIALPATMYLTGRVVAPANFVSFLQTGNKVMTETTSLVTEVRSGKRANFTMRVLWAFDDYNYIKAYDGEFRYLMGFLKYFGLVSEVSPDPALVPVLRATSGFVCNVSRTFCTGDLEEYADMAACMNFMAQRNYIPVTGNGGSDCILCRVIHSILLPSNPELHCPHTGPSGGGFCTDKPFEDHFSFFPTAIFLPNKF